MSQNAAFVDPADVVRQKNGRIDLFNTILSLQDSKAQIPVLDRTTSNAQTLLTSASLPVTKAGSSHDTGRPYPASSPHTTTSQSNTAGDSRKRPQSPSTTEGDGSHAAKLTRISAAPSVVEGAGSNVAKPARMSVNSQGYFKHAGGGGGRPFEKVFIEYCARPETIPPSIAYWHDEQHVILKDMYPKAKVHMLVLPRQRIDKVTDLSGVGGIRFVEQLVERAKWLLERLKKEWPMLEFKMGFHAIPSLFERPKNMPALKRHLQEHFDRKQKQKLEKGAVVLVDKYEERVVLDGSLEQIIADSHFIPTSMSVAAMDDDGEDEIN
ncbi:hypothetical protein BGZ72_005761 [Mortierella alpina]|nr:hypothetical protein BGZ72_005761 [Mortierella alpina]